ncbi:MAG: hypothetical protein WAX04_06770 [Oscillospiraceae bacterium]
MIDLAKYAGVDDSKFSIKLGMVDKFIYDKWDKCGCLVGVAYREASQEEREHNRENILDLAGRIKARVECGEY